MAASLLACASAAASTAVVDVPPWRRARSGKRLPPSSRTGDHELLNVSEFALQLSTLLESPNILGPRIAKILNSEGPIFKRGYWQVIHGVTSWIANQAVAKFYPVNKDVPIVEMAGFRDSFGLVTIGSRRQEDPGFKSIRDYVKEGCVKSLDFQMMKML